MHGSPEQLCSPCSDGCDAKVNPSSRIPLDLTETDSSFPAKTIDWLPADRNQWPSLLVHQGAQRRRGKTGGWASAANVRGRVRLNPHISLDHPARVDLAPSRWTRDRRRKNQSRPGSRVLLPSLAPSRFLLSPAVGHCARPHCVRCSCASEHDLSALRQSLVQTSTLTIPDRVCFDDEYSLGYGGSPLPSSKSGRMWNRLCRF